MRLFHASLGTALFLFGCQLGVQTGGSGGVIPASATESATENATDSGESTGSSTSSDTQTSTTTDAASKSATVTATHTSTGTGTNTATDSDTTPGAPEAGASGVLQKSDLKDNSVHLSWTAATGYPAFDLSYRLCVRPAGDDLTTVASLKAACDGGGGWQGVLGATLDQVVTGLSAKTDFAANVLVHASSGLESTYAVATFQTLVDQTPPVPGNGGVLSISDVTASNATVSWTAASDAETMAAKLEYHVCLRTAAFTVAADADANCRYLSGWSRGLTSLSVRGLFPSRVSSIVVLVRDALNNQALYQAASISTTARGASDVFVDDVFTITTDFGAGGLSVGDVVTFANGEVEAIAGLVFGTNAFSSIEAAAAAVGAGPGRIYLGTGTFTLAAQLSMSGDVKIIGAGQEKSKIMYGFDTAQAGNARGGIFGDAASAMEFCNLTIDGTGHSVHTGIRAAGTVGLYGVKMIDISYPPYHGISLASVGADATVENSVFVRSNRAGIYFYGTGTKLARWNDVTGKGDGDWVNSGIETGGGATVLVEENALRSLTGVASLDGSESIALYAYSYSGASFNYTARRNTIDNATYGFYISLIGGEFVAVAQENRLANVEFGMANDLTSVVDATRNWWGAATGPTYSGNANGTGAKLSEAYADNITYVPWLTE